MVKFQRGEQDKQQNNNPGLQKSRCRDLFVTVSWETAVGGLKGHRRE